MLWVMPLTVALMVFLIVYHAWLWRWRRQTYSRAVTFLTTSVWLVLLHFSLSSYEKPISLLLRDSSSCWRAA